VNGIFRAKQNVVTTRVWRGKVDAVFINGTEFGERNHLETTRIGEKAMMPIHPAMKTTNFLKERGTWTKVEVIGVRENNRWRMRKSAELFGRKAFD
jgi:hypothetical protein